MRSLFEGFGIGGCIKVLFQAPDRRNYACVSSENGMRNPSLGLVPGLRVFDRAAEGSWSTKGGYVAENGESWERGRSYKVGNVDLRVTDDETGRSGHGSFRTGMHRCRVGAGGGR